MFFFNSLAPSSSLSHPLPIRVNVMVVQHPPITLTLHSPHFFLPCTITKLAWHSESPNICISLSLEHTRVVTWCQHVTSPPLLLLRILLYFQTLPPWWEYGSCLAQSRLSWSFAIEYNNDKLVIGLLSLLSLMMPCVLFSPVTPQTPPTLQPPSSTY